MMAKHDNVMGSWDDHSALENRNMVIIKSVSSVRQVVPYAKEGKRTAASAMEDSGNELFARILLICPIRYTVYDLLLLGALKVEKNIIFLISIKTSTQLFEPNHVY